jgi:glycogen debranching enzyme
MTFCYGREFRSPECARSTEFLLTGNHVYCSSSVGGNTRKYHGLLVHRNRLYLAGLDELVNGVRISPQQYSGTQEDPALLHLDAFSLYPPQWIITVGDVLIKKTISFNHCVSITYEVKGDADILIRPLITDRPVNTIQRDPKPEFDHGPTSVRWSDTLLESSLPFTRDPSTYWNLLYERERERGYEPIEDLFSPGYFSGKVHNNQVSFCCARSNQQVIPIKYPTGPCSPLQWLEWAGDSFCHNDEIYAGYPWFCESWGRDSAISVTGLLTQRDKKSQVQGVLRHLQRHMKNGVIPNRFPDNYNTSDSSLWFIHAIGQYRRKWGDDSFIAEMRPVVAEIVKQYPLSPVATLDGSLISVVPQSTWMDTQFTPRAGKPVDINALWINALDESESMGIIPPVSVESARHQFGRFWNKDKLCFYDTIDPIDSSVRPNQIFALALGFVDRPRATAAISTIKRELLTPYGLRTLSPHDPKYKGHFCGDISYHNGCVWPWLTGWFTEALLRNGGDKTETAARLYPILAHIRESGAGFISEIFDGDFPYTPNGCIAQAWSVAEVARACRMAF